MALLIELERYEEAKLRFDRLVELLPLKEDAVAQWFAGLQSEVAYFLNDFDAAISYGRKSDKPFLKEVADNLT